MEARFHSTSHLGRCGIEADPLTLRELYSLPITRSELEKWATFFAGKFEVALFKGNEVQIRTYTDNMTALTEWASDMAEVLR